MIENGLYIISDIYFKRFKKLGCNFKDSKEDNRPVFCCLKDLKCDGLYWAIPLSEITEEKIKNGTIDRVKKYMSYKEDSLGWAYYHIAKTNKPAIYNISSAFPITDYYIEREWILNEKHFIVPYTSATQIIKRKLRRILSEENRFPNKFEQHITIIKDILINELRQFNITQKEIAVYKQE